MEDQPAYDRDRRTLRGNCNGNVVTPGRKSGAARVAISYCRITRHRATLFRSTLSGTDIRRISYWFFPAIQLDVRNAGVEVNRII